MWQFYPPLIGDVAMRTRNGILVLGVLLAVTGVLSAQPSDGNFPGLTDYLPFLEQTYVVGGRDSTLYEGNFAYHVPLVNFLGSDTKIDAEGFAGAWHFRPNLTLTGAFTVRQLTSKSSPVLTPSFRPYLTFNAHFLRRVQRSRRMGSLFDRSATFTVEDPILFVSPTIALTHYSNGSEGEFIVNGEINERNGDFSSTYQTYGIAFLWWEPLRFDVGELEAPITGRQTSIKVTRDEHPVLGLAGEMSSDLRNYYNPRKWSAEFELFVNSPSAFSWATTIAFDWFDRQPVNDLIDVTRYRVMAGITVRPKVTKLYIPSNVGLFVRYDFGQDYYNIKFGQGNNLFTFGIRTMPPVMCFDS